MNGFDKEFVMELFLENDSVSAINRLVVAAANIVSENRDNLSTFNEAMKREYNDTTLADACFAGVPITHRLKGFYERTVRNFSDEEYIERFKMKRTTVQALINFLKKYITPGIVTLDKKVHVFLWLLITDASYNDVGSLFDLHKSSVSYIFQEVASQLTEHRYYFISWPSIEEQHLTRIKVNSKFKFPNCVGFIDSCCFRVNSKRKRNDKLNLVLLQAVCDESLMFIDIHIGDRGKTRKSRIFKESSLSQELKNFVDFDNHILGDSKYRLQKNLITPFTSEELLTSEEMKFNEVHWKTRSYIGHAFELLKERFRKLNQIYVIKPEFVNKLITAACVLHNFILIHEGCSQVKEEVVTCDDGVTFDTDIVKTAIEKRQFLCNYINYMDTDSI